LPNFEGVPDKIQAFALIFALGAPEEIKIKREQRASPRATHRKEAVATYIMLNFMLGGHQVHL
jgi:hypothetical protein